MGGWVGEIRSVGKTIRSEVEKMRELCWSEKGDLPMFEWCVGGLQVLTSSGGQGWIDLSQSWKESFYKRF